MRYHKNGRAFLLQLIHPMIAFCLKEDIADRKRLIDNQNLRINRDIQRKGQAHKHSAGVGLHRLVHEVSDIGKV